MPLLHDSSGGIMTTLFDLTQYEVIPTKREIDPYWDELVLDCSGRVDVEDIPILPEQNINLDNLPEQNNCVLEKSKQLAQWTEKYSVNRGSKRHWYFRYCYYRFGKIHHIHIPGGNANSAIALERVERVKSAIANHQSPIEIQNLIRGGF
jgi:hypothetical protein